MACERLVAPSLRRIVGRRASPRDVSPRDLAGRCWSPHQWSRRLTGACPRVPAGVTTGATGDGRCHRLAHEHDPLAEAGNSGLMVSERR
jgi:hypothetical protein